MKTTMSFKQIRNVRELLLACAIVAGGASLTGCGASAGENNREHASAAKIKMQLMKSGVEAQMALEQFNSGDLDKALRGVDKAITLSPESPKAFVLRGRILIEKGNLEEARASLVEAERLDPSLVEAQYYLGIVFERFSQPEEALARYKKALELEPTNAQYVVAAAEMYISLKRFDEADALLSRQVESLAHNSAIRQTQGQLALLRGEPEKACQHFGDAHLLNPDDANIAEDLIRAQIVAGRFADAEFGASKLLKVKGNEQRRDLLQMRARCLVSLNRLADARSILNTLAADDAGGKDLSNWITLASVCVKLEDWARTKQAAMRIIAMAPDRAEGFMFRAAAQRAEGDIAGAIASLQRAAKANTTDASALVMLGLIQLDQKDLEGAKASLAEACRRNPADPQTRTLLEGVQSGRIAAVPLDQ